MPPKVSVLTAVHEPDPIDLEACLASVLAQTSSDWEHVVVDDGSSDPAVHEVLDRAAHDERVVVVRRAKRGGIVAASSDALARATGTWVALLDHDDLLEPDALAEMTAALDAHGADLAYSDHDLLTPQGHCTRPYLKADFSPEQLRNQNYVLHFLVARRELVDAVGGFRTGFDGAQDHDLLLRLIERTDRVAHVPRVLYHWRQVATSVASDPAAKPWAYDAGTRAVQEHCDRVGIDADVGPGLVTGSYRLRRRPARTPRVSVIIPTRGTTRPVWGVTRCFVSRAVQSLIDTSTYPDLEFVIVYDLDTPAAVLAHLRAIAGDRLVLIEYPAPFNFSEKNNVGAAAASGELLLLLNDDTELITADSIEVMAAHLEDDTVGMVGPKLLFGDGTVQDGGHVYNEHVLPGLVGWHGRSPGPGQLRPLAVEREVAGVTAGAAMMRHSVYDEVGGLDPILWMNFNDVDLSLKIRATGRRIIWTPYASWYHFESQTRPPSATPEEFDEIDRRWHDEINCDPYYNPNFAPRRTDWLERPWHSGFPPLDEVDTSVSHRSWMWDRLREGNWLMRLLSTAGVVLATIAGLGVVTWIAAGATHSGRGAFGVFVVASAAIVAWGSVRAVTRFRQRWVLSAALLASVAPSVIGLLATGANAALTWILGIAAGVTIGPLRRRSRPVAAAVAAVAVFAIGASWWRAGSSAPPRRAWGWYLHDAVHLAGEPSGAFGWSAVVLWWSAFLTVAWIVGRWVSRRAAAAVVGTPVALAAVATFVPELGSASTVGASFGIIAMVVVAMAARVDQTVPGSERLLNVVLAITACTWLLVAVDAVVNS